MKETPLMLILLSLFLSLLMGGLSFVTHRRHQDDGLRDLARLWFSLSFSVMISAVFLAAPVEYLALTMVGWIPVFRSLDLYLHRISQQRTSLKFFYAALGIGGFMTVALATFGQRFFIHSLPMALSIGGAGLFLTIRLAREKKKRSELEWTFFLGAILFFGSKLFFPWLRPAPGYALYSSAFDLVVYGIFAVSSIALSLEILKTSHDQELDQLVKERNQKLYSQSKYSELGMMSAGIAHEINNPLAVIQARATQLMRFTNKPEYEKEMTEGLAQILYTSERINRTVQGIREFVHQDDNAAFKDIGLKDVVDDVLVFCGQRLKNHGIHLRFYGLENFTVRGNKIQLEQVILNLINNSFDAIEFLPDKWIEMSVEKTNEKLHIFFKDSGPGIPPEVASRMMEPFFSTKDLRKGTGLGLALARGIAEQHGGKLIYLKEAQHTTFMLELPQNLEADWGMNVVH